MRKMRTLLFTVGAVALFASSSSLIPLAVGAETLPTEKECGKIMEKSAELQGWCTAINRRKGNCLACHMITTKKQWPEALPPGGNIAPPLVAMSARFPDKSKLRAQIWDATKKNAHTSMPPFGRHKLLSDKDIDAIVAYLLTI